MNVLLSLFYSNFEQNAHKSFQDTLGKSANIVTMTAPTVCGVQRGPILEAHGKFAREGRKEEVKLYELCKAKPNDLLNT